MENIEAFITENNKKLDRDSFIQLFISDLGNNTAVSDTVFSDKNNTLREKYTYKEHTFLEYSQNEKKLSIKNGKQTCHIFTPIDTIEINLGFKKITGIFGKKNIVDNERFPCKLKYDDISKIVHIIYDIDNLFEVIFKNQDNILSYSICISRQSIYEEKLKTKLKEIIDFLA